MLFCPKCNELSVTYVDALRQAFCTNLSHCLFTAKYDTWKDCQKGLEVKLKKWAKGKGLQVAPWSGAVIETDMDEGTLQAVTGLAKELHGVFTQASINNEMMSVDDSHSFEQIPENVRDTLVELACYINTKFARRQDE